MRIRRDGRRGEILQAVPAQEIVIEWVGLHILGSHQIAVGDHIALEEIATFTRADRPQIAIAPALRIFGAHMLERRRLDHAKAAVIAAVKENCPDVIETACDKRES